MRPFYATPIRQPSTTDFPQQKLCNRTSRASDRFLVRLGKAVALMTGILLFGRLRKPERSFCRDAEAGANSATGKNPGRYRSRLPRDQRRINRFKPCFQNQDCSAFLKWAPASPFRLRRRLGPHPGEAHGAEAMGRREGAAPFCRAGAEVAGGPSSTARCHIRTASRRIDATTAIFFFFGFFFTRRWYTSRSSSSHRTRAQVAWQSTLRTRYGP